jgi:flagellar biosynthesis protein FlhF
MVIRKYRGEREDEILQRIRKDLGPQAIILETQFRTKRSWFGLRQQREVEIWAGRGFGVVRDYAVTPSSKASRAGSAYAQHAGTPKAIVSSGSIATPALSPSKETERILQQMSELKSIISDTHRRVATGDLKTTSHELRDEFLSLTQSQISETYARDLVEKIASTLGPNDIKDRALIRAAVRKTLKDLIRCTDEGITFIPGRCTRVAFLGATGVGKTTTLAKLTAIFALKGKEVGVITCDTQRIAAAEQITRVAELVGVPVRRCAHPQEIKRAIDAFANMDLVMIDTAGRSPRNEERVKELRAQLEAAKPDETHLVLSVTSARETLSDIVERMSPLQFNRIVLTKLDEAVQTGVLLDVLSRVGSSVSFITTGQSIPHDIEVADSERLAGLILGEERVEA